MAICAPTLDLIFFSAHLPKACEPPDALINATIIPRIMRNKKIPALSLIAEIIPSLIMVLMVSTGLKPATNNAPITIPTKVMNKLLW